MTTKEQRLEMIKNAAEKIERGKRFKARLAAKGIAPIRHAQSETGSTYAVSDKELKSFEENHNAWTDSAQYANKYYGDVYRETTRFDNDWN